MSSGPRLPASQVLLALAVVAVWRTNFSVIKVALGSLPPLLLAVLRFAFALLPAVFFVPLPTVRWQPAGLEAGRRRAGAFRAGAEPGLATRQTASAEEPCGC